MPFRTSTAEGNSRQRTEVNQANCSELTSEPSLIINAKNHAPLETDDFLQSRAAWHHPAERKR
ncbi:hypothetical protein RISK_003710 [Rhodopirellula islandica]|uniref:Uncharacterized protein n=1 Tax=Rhodopirellula islandica TaxID=595434 RepID=A0A0J1EF22_RHOIS|nr:hypothetical protein RISK_003710 [Rhodopirellula islandica]